MGWAEDVATVREEVLRAAVPDVVSRDGSTAPFLEHRISSDFHIGRFLTAREGNVPAASDMLVAHLNWRRSFFPVENTPRMRAMWESTGGPDDCPRLRRAGWSKDNRPVVILNFWRGEFWEDGVTLVDAVHGFVDFLEQVVVACEEEAGPRGTEVKCIISGGPAPGQFAKRLVKIVEANFPEVCFVGLIYPIPRLIKVMVITVIWFIPARTRRKVHVLSTEAQLVHALNIEAKDLPEDLRGGVEAAVRRFRPDTALKQWKFMQEMLNREEMDSCGEGDDSLRATGHSTAAEKSEEESGAIGMPRSMAMACCLSRPRSDKNGSGSECRFSCFQRAWDVEEQQAQSSIADTDTGRPRPAGLADVRSWPPEPRSKRHDCYNSSLIIVVILLMVSLQWLRLPDNVARGLGKHILQGSAVQAEAPHLQEPALEAFPSSAVSAAPNTTPTLSAQLVVEPIATPASAAPSTIPSFFGSEPAVEPLPTPAFSVPAAPRQGEEPLVEVPTAVTAAAPWQGFGNYAVFIASMVLAASLWQYCTTSIVR